MSTQDTAVNGSATTASQLLAATYDSLTNAAFTFTERLPLPAKPLSAISTSERVAFLAKLRTATKEMQQYINQELTQRMDDDKARAAADAGKANGAGDESKEEENYGEELVDEEEA